MWRNGKAFGSKQTIQRCRHNKNFAVNCQQMDGELFPEKLPETYSQNKRFLNCVHIDEIEFALNKASQEIGLFGVCYLAKLQRSGIFVAVKFGQKSGERFKNALKI